MFNELLMPSEQYKRKNQYGDARGQSVASAQDFLGDSI